MTRRTMTDLRALSTIGRRGALLSSLAMLSGCGLLSTPPKPPVPGRKIPVLPPHNPLRVAAGAPPVTLPAPQTRTGWGQAGATAAHDAGVSALPARLRMAWHDDIGAGATYRRTLHAAPVIAGGRVFTVDANGVVEARAIADGHRLWRHSMRPRHDNSFAYGGGLAADDAALYVASGFGQLLALDPASGKPRWTKTLDQPFRSAPGLGGGMIFVIMLDNTLQAFDAKTGAFAWRFPTGSGAGGSMFGAGTPAYQDGIVVAGFGSGVLAGVNATGGSAVWEQSLAAGYAQTNPLDVSSIVASPVIAGGLAIATGLAGTTVAFDLRSGRRIWSISAGGGETPAVAGDWLFLLTEGQRLAAIRVADGAVGWVTDLPAYGNPAQRRQPLSWHGPLVAGAGLLLTGSDRRMIVVDALAGKLLTPPDQGLALNGESGLAPIAAAGTLFALTRNAVLTAYR